MMSNYETFQIAVAGDNPADVMLVGQALQLHGLTSKLTVVNEGGLQSIENYAQTPLF